MKINPEIAELLQPAYARCAAFDHECRNMRWQPSAGHVPRGFAGAAGELNEIELVLVFAEPGDPHESETHTGLDSAYDYASRCFLFGKDKFHKNVNGILESCWPALSFDQKMHKVLLIDSVMCSAKSECARVPASSSRHCVATYLGPVLRLVPGALVVALGRKAQDRLRVGGIHGFMSAFSVAPPGCNRREAKASWSKIADALNDRRFRVG